MLAEGKPREGNGGGYQTGLAVAEPERGGNRPILNQYVPQGSGVEYGTCLPSARSGHEDLVDSLIDQELNNVLKEWTVNEVCEA
jgi:hypothetical protein